MSNCRRLLLILVTVLLLPSLTLAAGVEVRFDPSTPAGGPFPSDLFTVKDDRHLTGLRVNLPRPDCVTRPTDCADIDVLNTLDGFNLQPRLTVPFTGAINPATVSSDTVFVVRLGQGVHDNHGQHVPPVVGINQVVWDPVTRTLIAESDELLEQHTRWALIVTDGVRDTVGDRVEPGQFGRLLGDSDFARDRGLKDYRKAALEAVAAAGVEADRVVGVSVFSTQSATTVLEKIREQIRRSRPAKATFLIGPGGARAVFPLSDLDSRIVFNRQDTVAGPLVPVNIPLAALDVIPGAIGRVAFGKYRSPDWLTPERYIPAIGTRSDVPVPLGENEIYFNLFLPAGTPPHRGWPVAIFGHGFGDNKNSSPFAVASVMADNGIATIAINVVGHGRGAAGTLEVLRRSGPSVIIPAGGRGIDQDGNGVIDSTEGVSAAPPRTIISSRDGLRQTVADLIQLVRVIEAGVDVDGDGTADLDPRRIYYFGQSFGGIYGVKFLAVEPNVRAGVPNVPGGSIIEIARLSPAFRGLVTLGLLGRVPALLNVFPVVPPLLGFQESIPLRDQPTQIGVAPGALAIQEVIDNTEWVSQSGNPVAYAPLLGAGDTPIILQFARGDRTVPNPTASALIRAGGLTDRTTFFRNDLVVAAIPGAPTNPHTFLTNIGGVPLRVAELAVAAQQQIGIFFATAGAVVVDPDGTGPFFEVPIAGELPETLGF